MNRGYLSLLLTWWALTFSALTTHGQITDPEIVQDELNLFDSSRNRAVPVRLYYLKNKNKSKNKNKLAIINHGYGGKNDEYSYIANALASQGYLVASIQHGLPGDEPLFMTGKLSETRRPDWERGVKSILFTMRVLEARYPGLDRKQCVVIGHSHGGDMAMLLATQHPAMLGKVISLDNRRMALPRTTSPRVYSIRSVDQPADEGVLPTPDEQRRFRISIVSPENTLHADMWDGGVESRKQEILSYVIRFVKD